jgi:hypothetical protein
MARHANPSTTMRYAHDLDDLDDYAGDYISFNRWKSLVSARHDAEVRTAPGRHS